MKLRWIYMIFGLAVLLALTGCQKKTPPAASNTPWALEVEYGDSGVTAETFSYHWVYQGQTKSSEGTDLLAQLSSIPFVNKSKTGSIRLNFSVEPDSCAVTCYTNADGYREAVDVPVSGNDTLTVPLEAGSYLFCVSAAWNETETAEAWGSATYYFRYLPAGDTGEQTGEISLYRIAKLTPDELFGVEVFHNGLNQQKTCRTTEDKGKILDFLKAHLSTDFTQVLTPTLEAEFVLRLALTDGSQLTLGYIPLDDSACLLLGGVPYEASPMELSTLWDSLRAEAVSLREATPEDTLETSETDPGEALGENYVHGYLRALDSQVTLDQMTWIDDPDEPNGYRLETGETGKTYPLAEDCAFWILQEHHSPFCRVAATTLWDWAQTTGWDVLFRFYLKNGEIIAIVEQYRP